MKISFILASWMAASLALTPSISAAALAITSPAVTIAALEAKAACARASQTAELVQLDPTTLANLERVRALCDAAAGLAPDLRSWPDNKDARMFDSAAFMEAVKALQACGDLADRRSKAGKTRLSPDEIERIKTPTSAAGGMAVFDSVAIEGFAVAAAACRAAQ